MNTFWTAAGGWWVQAAVSGGAALLLGWLGMAACRAPALRQQIGAWAIRAAVLAAVLSALPPWFLLPRPSWMTTPSTMEAKAEPTPPPVTEVELAPPEFAGVVEPEPVEWEFVPAGPVEAAEPPPLVEHATPEPAVSTDTPVSAAFDPVPLLLAGYAVAAGWLLLQLVWERLAVAWLLRDAAPLVGRARWVWDQLTAGDPGPRAVASGRVRSPLCVGFFRPRVVLPKRMADTADVPTLRWVLAHELDHHRRGDTRTAHWVGVARAVFFFVPWFWLVRRDLGLCQEFLADAAATRAGGTPADYAAFLVDLSGGRTCRRPLAAARMRAGKSDLFRRVHMLLNGNANANGPTRGFTVVAGAAALAAAVGLSGLGFADEPKKESAQVIEVRVKDAADGDKAKVVEVQVKDGKPVVVVDGKPVAKDVLKPVIVNGEALKPVRLRLQPPADVLVRPGGKLLMPVKADVDLRKQYEQQLKDFEEQIQKAADAEAKEQLEKTRDAYKKAMEEPLKKADAARKEVDAARKKLEQAERNNRIQNDDALEMLMEMQKQLQKQLEADLKKLDLPPGLFAPLDPNNPQAVDGLFKMLIDPQAGGLGDDLFFPGGVRNAAQPRLGVRVEKVPAVLAEQLDLPKDGGVVIAEVIPGTPAEKAGLKKSDVLLTLGGKDVPTDPEAFTAPVGKLKGGEKIDAVVLRKGKKESVKGIELAEAKKPGRVGGANESVQVQINDDAVTLNATVNDVAYTVTGTLEKGKVVPSKIVVASGKESKEYDSLEKLPESDRAAVERVLGKVRLFGGK